MQTNRWFWMSAIVALLGASAASADEPSMLERIKKTVSGARISLSQAIEAASKEVAGGQVVEAELEDEHGSIYYEVSLLVGGKLKEASIDSASGKVLGVKDAQIGDDEKQEIESTRKALAAAKITFALAIGAAEKEVKGGQAYEAEVEMENNKPVIAVTILVGEKVMEAEVDAVTGKVIETEEEPLPLALWTFDSEAAGKTPVGWRIAETNGDGKIGKWAIAADGDARTKPNVLKLETTADGSTFNLFIAEKASFKDLDLRVRLKANSGKEDQGGGPIWRCKDENNYYICRINPLEGNFRVYKVEKGRRSQLESAKLETKTGQWHQVRAVMIGNKIACYVDGKKCLETTDDTFKDAGKIGLWTKADASSSFDNVVVDAPHAEKHDENADDEDKHEGKNEDDHDDDD